VDYVARWSERTELPAKWLVRWIGIGMSKFQDWKARYGKVNEHNAQVPRDHWLEDWERRAILDFEQQYPLEGYRRLTFMMNDAEVVAAAPVTVYRVLKGAGRIGRQPGKPSTKGKGFVQPDAPHRHWHIDVSYLNIAGTFYFLCSILDGFSRAIVHWEIGKSMTEPEVELVVQRAREKFPGEQPRIISDNGPQFIAKDFKEFLRMCSMTHVRTSPYYPQSNGKIERWHRSLKSECLRPGVPLSLDDARRLVENYVTYYNETRLHSAIGYVAPHDRMQGLDGVIHVQRDRRLEEARERRRQNRAARAAPQTAAAGSPAAHSPRVDLAALRKNVSMEQVLQRLHWLDRLRGGAQRRGPCPVHDRDGGPERGRSFSVNLPRGVFRCFHPQCGAQGNALDLWAAVHGLPIREAALQLQETPPLKNNKPPNREEEPVLLQSLSPTARDSSSR
jgi:transposase InsO family protein